MAAIDVSHLSYSYGKREALHDLDFSIPEGALYALLGPNGSGKTTLLQILMGLRRPGSGRATMLGVDTRELAAEHRQRVSYVAEGQPLPGWMTLDYLESYLAPLYPSWDRALARQLRARFALDPRRRVGTLSRGEQMKAALLCALAPRPELLIMDEPFTGMDALVKDELVRGLLDSAASDGWTVVISSHDLAELEMLADSVGFLNGGRILISESMDELRGRFKRVTVVADEDAIRAQPIDDDWLSVERAGRRLTFIVSDADETMTSIALPARFPYATRVDVDDTSLREIFVAMARSSLPMTQMEAAR
jgi:ABC-2 type transport system ATP-binding protein